MNFSIHHTKIVEYGDLMHVQEDPYVKATYMYKIIEYVTLIYHRSYEG